MKDELPMTLKYELPMTGSLKDELPMTYLSEG